MEITLVRTSKSDNATFGQLEIKNNFRCYTLEDLERDQKIVGKTAIPRGRYEIKNTWSPHFSCMMPLICDVPNFEGVRIHAGNTSLDTEGCVLIGLVMDVKAQSLVQSRTAIEIFYGILNTALQTEQVFITIQ